MENGVLKATLCAWLDLSEPADIRCRQQSRRPLPEGITTAPPPRPGVWRAQRLHRIGQLDIDAEIVRYCAPPARTR